MRLLSYNIHGCVGADRVEDARRVLDLLEAVDADLVALQEVYDDDAEDRSFLRGLEPRGALVMRTHEVVFTAVSYGMPDLRKKHVIVTTARGGGEKRMPK